jgi:hypothetical protein
MSHLDLEKAFFEVIRQHKFASPLKDAALSEDMSACTWHLTAAIIRTCEDLG